MQYIKAKIKHDNFYFLSGEFRRYFEHAGSINTAEVDFVVIAILVLIALAHHQVAVRGWQANSEPVCPEIRNPVPGGQIFVHGSQELKTRRDSSIIQSESWRGNTKPSSESASPYSSGWLHTFW